MRQRHFGFQKCSQRLCKNFGYGIRCSLCGVGGICVGCVISYRIGNNETILCLRCSSKQEPKEVQLCDTCQSPSRVLECDRCRQSTCVLCCEKVIFVPRRQRTQRLCLDCSHKYYGKRAVFTI
jgi:hypothetical protein